MIKVIDADSHMFEQPGLWRDYMPANQHDLALDLEEDELGYTWLTHKGNRLIQCYISEPGKLWESYGLPHQRQREGSASAPQIHRDASDVPRSGGPPRCARRLGR